MSSLPALVGVKDPVGLSVLRTLRFGLRRLWRLLALAAILAWSILDLLFSRPNTRALRAQWLSRLCRRVIRLCHVTVTTIGPVPACGAVISNHLSYVDIPVHAGARPCVFVSKIELCSTLIFGWISQMAGTIYVNRSSGRSALQAGAGMAKGLRDNLPVVFFPEGTTGVGDLPTLPFHGGLIAMAIAADQPVIASFIHYELTPEDLSRGKSIRDDVHWGSQTLFRHVWNYFDLGALHATIRFAPEPILFSPAAITNRKIAAREAQAAVNALALAVKAPAQDRQVV